jgi:hypothetical protein
MQYSSLYLSILLVCTMLTTCQEPAPIPQEDDRHSELLKAKLAEHPIVRDDALFLPALVDFDEALRVRQEGGWGLFDVICSVYNGDPKRIQLVKQQPRFFSDPECVGYAYKERLLSDSAYDRIMGIYQALKLDTFPLDLEPETIVFDGNNFSIVKKDKSGLFFTTWQLERKSHRDTIYQHEKEIALNFFKDLLVIGNYPSPRLQAIGERLNQDSIRYLLNLDDETLVDSIEYKCSKCRLEKDDTNTNIAYALYAEKDSISVRYDIWAKLILHGGRELTLETVADLKEPSDNLD